MGKTPDHRAVENQTKVEYNILEFLLDDEKYCDEEVKRYKAMKKKYGNWRKNVEMIDKEIEKAEKGRKKTIKDIDNQKKLMRKMVKEGKIDDKGSLC